LVFPIWALGRYLGRDRPHQEGAVSR
jgi:hypothetical protein